MSESRFNRAHRAPPSNEPWAHGLRQDAPALASIPSPSQPSSLESFFDEPTVEFDATVLSGMLALSANEPVEETRTYQIPAEVLALARGDETVAASAAARARPAAPLVVPLAHVLVMAWAIALGYFLVQIIDG